MKGFVFHHKVVVSRNQFWKEFKHDLDPIAPMKGKRRLSRIFNRNFRSWKKAMIFKNRADERLPF